MTKQVQQVELLNKLGHAAASYKLHKAHNILYALRESLTKKESFKLLVALSRLPDEGPHHLDILLVEYKKKYESN